MKTLRAQRIFIARLPPVLCPEDSTQHEMFLFGTWKTLGALSISTKARYARESLRYVSAPQTRAAP